MRQERGLTPAPRAARVTLLRRAYLDLIGLPPSPAETAAFLADTRPDGWERVIDTLLASPHYGERWGRHWLDVARYADSSGFEHDIDRPNAWRYRDYVIRAFNDDKPYNVFLKEQIAGDELDTKTDDTLIATGFLRAGPRVAFREKDNPERRYEYLDDLIATTGRGVLGLTVQCARCHNHKFDPIPQKDYYSLEATFFGYGSKDRKSTRLNSSHLGISYAVFCLKKKTNKKTSKPNATHLGIPYAGLFLKRRLPDRGRSALATQLPLNPPSPITDSPPLTHASLQR